MANPVSHAGIKELFLPDGSRFSQQAETEEAELQLPPTGGRASHARAKAADAQSEQLHVMSEMLERLDKLVQQNSATTREMKALRTDEERRSKTAETKRQRERALEEAKARQAKTQDTSRLRQAMAKHPALHRLLDPLDHHFSQATGAAPVYGSSRARATGAATTVAPVGRSTSQRHDTRTAPAATPTSAGIRDILQQLHQQRPWSRIQGTRLSGTRLPSSFAIPRSTGAIFNSGSTAQAMQQAMGGPVFRQRRAAGIFEKLAAGGEEAAAGGIGATIAGGLGTVASIAAAVGAPLAAIWGAGKGADAINDQVANVRGDNAANRELMRRLQQRTSLFSLHNLIHPFGDGATPDLRQLKALGAGPKLIPAPSHTVRVPMGARAFGQRTVMDAESPDQRIKREKQNEQIAKEFAIQQQKAVAASQAAKPDLGDQLSQMAAGGWSGLADMLSSAKNATLGAGSAAMREAMAANPMSNMPAPDGSSPTTFRRRGGGGSDVPSVARDPLSGESWNPDTGPKQLNSAQREAMEGRGGKRGSAKTGDIQMSSVNYLVSKGLSAKQAAGIVGNLSGESLTNAQDNTGDGGAAYGIAQWHAPRQAALRAYAKLTGKDPTKRQTQLDFVLHESGLTKDPTSLNMTAAQKKATGFASELRGKYRDIVNNPNASASQVAGAFVAGYEHPADVPGNVVARGRTAESVLSNYNQLQDAAPVDYDKQRVAALTNPDLKQTWTLKGMNDPNAPRHSSPGIPGGSSGTAQALGTRGDSEVAIAARIKAIHPELGSGECVDLARRYVNDKGGVKNWRRGTAASGGQLPQGSPLATFMDRQGNLSDKYDGGIGVGKRGNDTTHAAILDHYVYNADGTVKGAYVREQWHGQAPRLAFKPIGGTGKRESDLSNYYSVNNADGTPIGDQNNPLNRGQATPQATAQAAPVGGKGAWGIDATTGAVNPAAPANAVPSLQQQKAEADAPLVPFTGVGKAKDFAQIIAESSGAAFAESVKAGQAGTPSFGEQLKNAVSTQGLGTPSPASPLSPFGDAATQRERDARLSKDFDRQWARTQSTAGLGYGMPQASQPASPFGDGPGPMAMGMKNFPDWYYQGGAGSARYGLSGASAALTGAMGLDTPSLSAFTLPRLGANGLVAGGKISTPPNPLTGAHGFQDQFSALAQPVTSPPISPVGVAAAGSPMATDAAPASGTARAGAADARDGTPTTHAGAKAATVDTKSAAKPIDTGGSGHKETVGQVKSRDDSAKTSLVRSKIGDHNTMDELVFMHANGLETVSVAILAALVGLATLLMSFAQLYGNVT